MSVSSANIGTLYVQNYNGIPFTQPGGPGTQVFPAQANNAPMVNFPVPGQVINEVGMSLWLWGCGHGTDVVKIFMDFDQTTGMSAACICCAICTYLQRLIEPYDAIYSVIDYPIVLP